jgi:hypothetical protein
MRHKQKRVQEDRGLGKFFVGGHFQPRSAASQVQIVEVTPSTELSASLMTAFVPYLTAGVSSGQQEV